MADFPFDRTLALSSVGEGRYEVRIGARWNVPTGPNGGLLAAALVRAAEAELGAGAPPARAVTAHYLDALAPDAAELHVEVLRAGRRVQFVEVRLVQDGRPVAQGTVLFSPARADATDAPALDISPPAVPPPEAVEPVGAEAFPGAPTVFSQLEMRPVFGGRIFSGASEALAGGWIALRGDDAPLDPARLCALCDLWWPALYSTTSRPLAVPTLTLTVHLRMVARAVSPPVLACFRTRHIAEGHLEETGSLWSREGTLLAESRQLALVR